MKARASIPESPSMMDHSADPAAIDRGPTLSRLLLLTHHMRTSFRCSLGGGFYLVCPWISSLHNQRKGPSPKRRCFFSPNKQRRRCIEGGWRGRGRDIYLVLTSVYAEAMHARTCTHTLTHALWDMLQPQRAKEIPLSSPGTPAGAPALRLPPGLRLKTPTEL